MNFINHQSSSQHSFQTTVNNTIEKDSDPSGNQLPEVWKSNTIGCGNQIPEVWKSITIGYGNQLPPHIKETNTST